VIIGIKKGITAEIVLMTKLVSRINRNQRERRKLIKSLKTDITKKNLATDVAGGHIR
jgi:hypothetical protein